MEKKKIKLKLEELNVESFITEVDKTKAMTLAGAGSIPDWRDIISHWNPAKPTRGAGESFNKLSELRPQACAATTRASVGTSASASVVSLGSIALISLVGYATEIAACPSVNYPSCNPNETCWDDRPTAPNRSVCAKFLP